MQNITSFDELKSRRWFDLYPEEIREQMETYKVPEIPAYRLLESAAKYYPNAIAVVYEPENFMVNYRDLLAMCERFASGLQNTFGVKKGDAVAISSRNYPEFIIALHGIEMVGGIYTACNPMLIKSEIEYQLKDTQAKVAVISHDMAPVFRSILTDKKTDLEAVIVFTVDRELKPPLYGGGGEEPEAPFFKFSRVFSDAPYTKPIIDPQRDLTAVIYTSGTTGYPKGVMISHYNTVSAAIQYHAPYTGVLPKLDAEGFLKCVNHARDLTADWEYPIRYGIDSVLSIPPWTQMMSYLSQMKAPLMAAQTIFPLPAFTVDAMLDLVRRWRIAFAGGPPQLMTGLLTRSEQDRHALYPVRVWTMGGAPVPTALAEKFVSIVSGVVSEGYALTESTCASIRCYCNRSTKEKYGSIGIPVPLVDAKIVDVETGTREMPVGEEGELIQNGPNISQGYMNRPQDTKETYRNGWLHTGDLAVMDENGRFHITGRKKELIIYKGYNIAPRMLEEILYEHPGVFECAVVGRKDEAAGEIPVAFISKKPGSEMTPEDIMAFVNVRVAPYKKIREVRFIDKIPLNPNGKILRQELMKLLEP